VKDFFAAQEAREAEAKAQAKALEAENKAAHEATGKRNRMLQYYHQLWSFGTLTVLQAAYNDHARVLLNP
jgi:hypothetical protein